MIDWVFARNVLVAFVLFKCVEWLGAATYRLLKWAIVQLQHVRAMRRMGVRGHFWDWRSAAYALERSSARVGDVVKVPFPKRIEVVKGTYKPDGTRYWGRAKHIERGYMQVDVIGPMLTPEQTEALIYGGPCIQVFLPDFNAKIEPKEVESNA